MKISASAVITLLLAVALLAPASGQNTSEDEPGWTNLNPDPRPQVVFGAAMTYDASADRVTLYGGWGPNFLTNQTWSFDFNTNTWVNLNPTEAPPRRFAHAMAYDDESGRVILFGGNPGTMAAGLGDTWAYDYNTNTWTNMTPALSPPLRTAHAMAYDSDSDRVIFYGGSTGPFHIQLDDTWAYDHNTNTWTPMNPTVSPEGRSGHAMTYDAESDRVILFGGTTRGGFHRDTWSYDFNADQWSAMTPDPGPPPRRQHAMTYDSQADRVILFGGDTPNRVSDETWAFLLVPPAPDSFNPFVAVVASALLVGLAIVALWGRKRRAEGA